MPVSAVGPLPADASDVRDFNREGGAADCQGENRREQENGFGIYVSKLSLVTCHLSLVTCHLSLVTCNHYSHEPVDFNRVTSDQ